MIMDRILLVRMGLEGESFLIGNRALTGGVFYTEHSTITFTGSQFTGNCASSGGVVHALAAVTYLNDSLFNGKYLCLF
jgi:hypothetical protein